MYNKEENIKNIDKIISGYSGAENRGTLQRDVEMSRFTTFRIGGPADVLYTAASEGELSVVVKYLHDREQPYFVLGNGSNLLVRDNGYRGTMIRLGAGMATISVEDTTLTAGAAALLSSAASTAAGASLSGMEFASGIPGSVGGGVFMNAGAYGGEIVQIIRSARAVLPDGSIREYSADELGLGYRTSIFQSNGAIITSVTFGLSRGNRDEILALARDLNERRRSKQPLDMPSAGSTFRRPQGYFAGKLIQDSGCSNLAVGGARVSPKHSGFIINDGGATAQDVLDLIRLVQVRVKDNTGVTLEPEVRIIGE